MLAMREDAERNLVDLLGVTPFTFILVSFPYRVSSMPKFASKSSLIVNVQSSSSLNFCQE